MIFMEWLENLEELNTFCIKENLFSGNTTLEASSFTKTTSLNLLHRLFKPSFNTLSYETTPCSEDRLAQCLCWTDCQGLPVLRQRTETRCFCDGFMWTALLVLPCLRSEDAYG